jgi:hypothetical protein
MGTDLYYSFRNGEGLIRFWQRGPVLFQVLLLGRFFLLQGLLVMVLLPEAITATIPK